MPIRSSTARALQLGAVIATAEQVQQGLLHGPDITLGSRARAAAGIEEVRTRLLAAARDLDRRVGERLRSSVSWWVQFVLLVFLVALGVGFVFAAVRLMTSEDPSNLTYLFTVGPPPLVVFLLNQLRRMEVDRITVSLLAARFVPRIEAAGSIAELEAIAREMSDSLRLLTNAPRPAAPGAGPRT
ncbi:hypothetical protein GobsT_11890 [Gemmata obscuriglobus]|uniref:Uncharacterized protein n=1 Tax=Gemmata obscuriglobus TaxID=114 RepID=A0A2Z3H9N3_9BACT|nr:hypothetical protein [Gemmata obscuriglobus]AWM40336.1 hypothetical protein C1280_27250 [Gemmata obscuriglobus]QEG26450.1 hypothetical protein GobsT_11890 [Gemmata obscuriglobus]VTS01638.1 unnamed protein product [Gemmata obscuriglobus UQM 2246]